ncbi:MAG: hypothetical protein AABX84_01410, partial [Nanoarchaeota archaeon]
MKPAEGRNKRKTEGRRSNFDRKSREVEEKERAVGGWEPKTKLGMEVKSGKIRDIDEILDSKKKILESEIV